MSNNDGSSNNAITEALDLFSAYTKEIESIVFSNKRLTQSDFDTFPISSILDGGPTGALRKLVPLHIRKRSGIFFTSNRLASKVADRLQDKLRSGYKIIDPACGTGNLLTACAKYLPTGSTLAETINIWSRAIYGYDLHPEFVWTAKLRLALLALSLHPGEKNMIKRFATDELFPKLIAGNVFDQMSTLDDTCVVVNPPFGYVPAPTGCKWGRGKIQTAALFYEKLLSNCRRGQEIVAILPDVLRSGTRYKKWRDVVSSKCARINVEIASQFDEFTDVDVFILDALVGSGESEGSAWPDPPSIADTPYSFTVADLFEVHVGSVVPHRDPLTGPSHPYIHVRTAPAWQILHRIPEERPYAGRVFLPPFVVAHRTSSPNDRHRCIATVVNENRPVAVENHLLVLTPHSKSLKDCLHLLHILSLPQSSRWLNERIRCRHITVSAMCELPLDTPSSCNVS